MPAKKSVSNKFVIKISKIEGKGAFAARDIKKGEVITIMQGKRTSIGAFTAEYRKGNKRLSCDPLQVGVASYIALAKPCVYINHSCNPNAAMQKTRALVAMRNIREGEEIVFDYSTTEWTPWVYPPYYAEGWPMRCQCESKHCRKWIACFPCLPKKTQQKYVKGGFVQDYIYTKLTLPLQEQRCFVCEAQLAKK